MANTVELGVAIHDKFGMDIRCARMIANAIYDIESWEDSACTEEIYCSVGLITGVARTLWLTGNIDDNALSGLFDLRDALWDAHTREDIRKIIEDLTVC